MEQSWCFRGERLRYRSSQVPNASAKLLLFFDMAMGWSGLRAVLVRIACMCPNDWAKQEKKTQGVTEATLVTMPNMIKFYSSYKNYSGYSL